MSIVVALNGLPRVGKDTMANHLAQHFGYTRAAFADKLYEEVAESFHVLVEDLQDHGWKTEPRDCLAIWHSDDPEYRQRMLSLGFDMVEPRTSRFHTQHWGTEYRRAQNPNYWLEGITPVLEASSGSIVISDLREDPLEYEFLRQFASKTGRQFTCIEIIKDGTVKSNHSSDNGIRREHIDLTVQNFDGDPEHMFYFVKSHIISINWEV